MDMLKVPFTAHQLSVLRLSLYLASQEIRKDMAGSDVTPADKEEYLNVYWSMVRLTDRLRKAEERFEKEGA